MHYTVYRADCTVHLLKHVPEVCLTQENQGCHRQQYDLQGQNQVTTYTYTQWLKIITLFFSGKRVHIQHQKQVRSQAGNAKIKLAYAHSLTHALWQADYANKNYYPNQTLSSVTTTINLMSLLLQQSG